MSNGENIPTTDGEKNVTVNTPARKNFSSEMVADIYEVFLLEVAMREMLERRR